jgi:putative PIN family toxin of toxin-antitoxin system
MSRRIVIDTNVLVAGLRSRKGASFRLLSLVGSDAFQHCVSVPLLFQYEDVLRRKGLVRVSREVVDDTLDYLCASADRREIYFLWRPQLPDAGDDLVLEVAVAGRCDTIVTFNLRDFVGAERFGVRAQTPASFLTSLRKAGLL